MIDISIIIVSWNVRALLEKCLRSIEQTKGILNLEVFVIDNASTDGTSHEIRKFRNSVATAAGNYHVILNRENRGFAAANNQGITKAAGEYVLLLNPDTELQPGALQQMLIFMQSHPRCGVLGPKLLNTDGSHQPSVRHFPDTWSPILMSLGITRGPVQHYLARTVDYALPQQVDQVMGASFLIRRDVTNKIGMLDERFYIWFEEVDFCRRVYDAGWEVWYTPQASVIHHGAQSFAQALTLKKQWWFSRSLLRFFWKHRQYGAYSINLIAVPFRLIVGLFL